MVTTDPRTVEALAQALHGIESPGEEWPCPDGWSPYFRETAVRLLTGVLADSIRDAQALALEQAAHTHESLYRGRKIDPEWLLNRARHVREGTAL